MFKSFDEITRFRIINAIVVYFGLNLLVPSIVNLRGELLTSTMISLIMIALTLSVKINNYITKFSISEVYKIGNIFHLFLTVSTLIYFYNPWYFIYLNAVLGIIEIAIFSSYSIQLDEYLAKNYPEKVKDFKIYRNSKMADSTLLGLGVSGVLTAFVSIDSVFVLFIIYNGIFSVWLFWNWRFFDRKELLLF